MNLRINVKLTSHKLDLSFIADKAEENRNQEEAELLAIAQTNGNSILELSDLRQTQKSPSSLFKGNINIRGGSMGFLMQDYRHLLIHSQVQAYLGSSTDPSFVDKISSVIWINSSQVANLSAMMDRLFPVLAHLQKTYNPTGLISFCHLWINIYNLGDAHKTWRKRGNNPVLPGHEMDEFVEKTLRRLENGVIIFGDLSSKAETDNFAAAVYNPNSDSILTIQPLMTTGLSAKTFLEKIYFSLIVSHEAFHAWQDAGSNESLNYSDLETEAEIFSIKCLIMMYGYKMTKALMKNIENWLSIAMQQGALQKTSPPAEEVETTETPALNSDFNKMIQECSKTASLDVNTIRLRAYRIADQELKSGKIDTQARQEFAIAYAREATYNAVATMLMKYVETLSSQFSSNPQDTSSPTSPLNQSDLIFLSPAEFRQQETESKATKASPGDNAEFFYSYIDQATRRLTDIYSQFGPEVAWQFFRGQYLPHVFSDEIINAYGLSSAGVNGLKRELKGNQL